MAGLDSEQNHNDSIAESSAQALQRDDDNLDSGSDFVPGNKEIVEVDDEPTEDVVMDEDPGEEELEGARQSESPSGDTNNVKAVRPPAMAAKGKGKAGVSKKSSDKPMAKKSVPPRMRRQMYALPTPSVHHRHRAVSLYSPGGHVERLKQLPELFRAPTLTFTNACTQDKSMDRVDKAWGYNVGAGPLWEIAEDRAWYKEAVMAGAEGAGAEGKRRPIVFQEVDVRNGWKFLSKEEAVGYLPTDVITTEEGNLKSPPPVGCFFGRYDNQTRIEINMFDAFSMARFLPESAAHVFNPGAPAWGMDWCPIHQDERPARHFKQYLAVSPFPSNSHSPEIGVRVSRPSYSCVQIWTLSPSAATGNNVADYTQSDTTKNIDVGMMKCEMVLCIEDGPALELKWCPLPSHDSILDSKTKLRKLGILAGTFEDGSLSIFVVPDPEDVRSRLGPVNSGGKEGPIYVVLPEPLIRIELEETCCWSLDWANSEVIAIGTTNGVLAVYDIGPVIRASSAADSPTQTTLLPTHYISVHQSAIRALAWTRAPPSSGDGKKMINEDPTVLVSGGYDGMECMTDIREEHGCIMNRTRDVINAVSYSPYAGGPVSLDHENVVKAYSASPSMLGRGHTLLEPLGPVWSISTSDYHPQLAVGSADGSCSTTNMLRSTRKSGSVPFFIHKIFQMDFRRKTGEFRMLEKFLPQETQDRPPATRNAKAKPVPEANASGAKLQPLRNTGAWPQQVGVHKTTWNSGNGLASCGLLASATSSGLCRVDNLWGRWIWNKVPYGGIRRMRGEEKGSGTGDEMDVDGYDEQSDEDD